MTTLNFLPFNRAARIRSAEQKNETEARVAEICQALNEEQTLTPVPCETCGGFFLPTKLKAVNHVPIQSGKGTVLPNERKQYCGGCHLGIDLELKLVTDKGETLDTVHFSVGEGYLQPFDFQGEEQTLIGVEDYAHTTCDDCGEFQSVTKCRKCSRKK
jgi:hypothetical protein